MTVSNVQIIKVEDQIEKAPIEMMGRERIDLALDRVKVSVPDAPKMTPAQRMTIAHEVLLYRIIPGRDMHYFLRGDKLERVPDYKYLISFTEFRERLRTGNRNPEIDYIDQDLTDEEKLKEGLTTDHVAVAVTVTTADDRRRLRAETKAWVEAGFELDQAYQLARQSMQVGRRAIGAVLPKKDVIPAGWSPRQKAFKLAIKNAIHFRWGEPTVDELRMYAEAMTRLDASFEDWIEAPPGIPAEAQARYADHATQARRVYEDSEMLSSDERQQRLKTNGELLHGADEGAIGEDYDQAIESDWREFAGEIVQRIDFFEDGGHVNAITNKLPDLPEWDGSEPVRELYAEALAEYAQEQEFYQDIADSVPYFNHARHVKNTLTKLEESYGIDREDELRAVLNKYANSKADGKAAGQPELFTE